MYRNTAFKLKVKQLKDCWRNCRKELRNTTYDKDITSEWIWLVLSYVIRRSNSQSTCIQWMESQECYVTGDNFMYIHVDITSLLASCPQAALAVVERCLAANELPDEFTDSRGLNLPAFYYRHRAPLHEIHPLKRPTSACPNHCVKGLHEKDTIRRHLEEKSRQAAHTARRHHHRTSTADQSHSSWRPLAHSG